MEYTNIIKRINNKICYLTINRRKFLNALNNSTITELSSVIKSSNKDISVRCVIITGSEKKAFVLKKAFILPKEKKVQKM